MNLYEYHVFNTKLFNQKFDFNFFANCNNLKVPISKRITFKDDPLPGNTNIECLIRARQANLITGMTFLFPISNLP